MPIAVLCSVVALIALLAYGLAQNEPDRQVEESLWPRRGEQAPALELPALDGDGSGWLADYRGRVVVLNFWASWCEPCREESPLLDRWHRRMSERGGTVLGMDVLDVTGDAKDFIREYGLSYPMLKDREGETIESYGVVAARDVRDRPAGPNRGRAARAGGQGVHDREGRSAACGELRLTRHDPGRAPAGAPGRARHGAGAECPQTTLGDIEDEVMCPVCGTPLGLATEAPQAQQERAYIQTPDRRLPLQGRDQDGARRPVRRRRAGAARRRRRRRVRRPARVLVPALGLLAAGGGIALRWCAGAERRAGRVRARRPAGAGGDDSRLDADMERYDL